MDKNKEVAKIFHMKSVYIQSHNKILIKNIIFMTSGENSNLHFKDQPLKHRKVIFATHKKITAICGPLNFLCA